MAAFRLKQAPWQREIWGPSLLPLSTQMCFMLLAQEGFLSRGGIMMHTGGCEALGDEVGWDTPQKQHDTQQEVFPQHLLSPPCVLWEPTCLQNPAGGPGLDGGPSPGHLH